MPSKPTENSFILFLTKHDLGLSLIPKLNSVPQTFIELQLHPELYCYSK